MPVWTQFARYAAAILLTCSIALGTAAAVSPTVRAAVVEWVTEWYENSVLYRFFGEASFEDMPKYQVTELPPDYYDTGISTHNKGGDHIKKKLWESCILLGCILFVLSGCVGAPLKNEVPVAPAIEQVGTLSSVEDSVSAELPPEVLTFNGTDYPLDVEELMVGSVGLEQLRWASGLKRLYISTNKELDWSLLQGIETMETLELSFEGGAVLNADLSALTDMPSLKEISIAAQCPMGTINLPAVGSLQTCSILLDAGADSVDISSCTNLDAFYLDGSGVGALELGEGATHMTFTGFAPVLSSLHSANRLERLSLNVPQELSPDAFPSQLTWLTLNDPGSGENRWDLAGMSGSALERLTIASCTTEDLSHLVNMDRLVSLQISDEYVDDLSVLNQIPGLESLILLVDPSGENAADWDLLIGQELRAVDRETLALLTSLSPAPLIEFMEQGGTLTLYRDLSRR